MKYANKNVSYKELFPHYFRIICQLTYEKSCKPLLLLKAWWWGIKIGKQGSVNGLPVFRKTPGSTFSIGQHYRILSTFSSNLHGLNRKTMFNTISPSASLSIGDNCGFSATVIACGLSINIGNRVMVGANSTITDTDSHSIHYKERHPDFYSIRVSGWKEDVRLAPIVIEDDVFIGMNTLVLKGVTIGKGSVIGAGSVVSKSIPPNVIAAGNPARVIRNLE
jgi:acetyltransferase-like isoleucine patch superfamily enzyme